MLERKLFDGNTTKVSRDSMVKSIFELKEPGRVDRLHLLLEQGSDLFPMMLIESARRNATDIFLALETLPNWNPAILNVKYRGTTPLIEAVKFGSLESVRILLSKNANPTADGSSGKSAKEIAEEFKWPIEFDTRFSIESIEARQNEIRRILFKASQNQ